MSELPPTYVAYPRGSVSSYGSPERLESLAGGYFGLNWTFLFNVVLLLALTPLRFLHMGSILVPAVYLVTAFAIGLATYSSNKKIGIGKNWPAAYPILASTLMGLNAALCFGIFGYVVMQQIALKEIYRYGIPRSFLGVKKFDMQAMVAQMRSVGLPPEGIAPPILT